MDSIAQSLRAEFEALKNEIAAAYHASGTMASGNWPDTLEVQASENGAAITGAGYIEGRGQGKPPPSEAIEQWIVGKGIAAQLENGLTVSSLAFLIARKIGREGWKPPQGTESFIEAVVTPQRIQAIIDKVGEIHLQRFTATIISYLKAA
ncbi:hypothetical protein [uncultured Flavobacterium sp.]|uniref:hypothetical protein n=1 Tax=uncultured Flavobacterium sp. TaxID=165435 RepID=UPI0025DF4853|nr:hypothetical protein [uncultured Flavobacterium sp.]